MAGPALSVYRTRVRNRMAAHTADTFLTDARVDEAVNNALGQTVLEHDWPWLQTSNSFPLVPGTTDYALGATFLKVKSVTLPLLGQPVQQRTVQEIDQVIVSITGVPQYYAVYGNNIELRPSPAQADTIKIRFYRTEPVLVAGVDTSLILDPFTDMVIEYAAYLLFRATRESDKAADALSAYKQMVERAQDNIKQSREPLRITVRPGSEF